MRFPREIVWLILWTVCVAEGKSKKKEDFFLYSKTFADMLFAVIGI